MDKKLLRRIGWILLFLVYGVYLGTVCMRVPLNSDHANQLLQAEDILKGNILLKGWNLTGVSFRFTELPFYLLATGLFGARTYSYVFCITLMAFVLFTAGFLLAEEGRSFSFSDFILFLAAAGMPTLAMADFSRGHSGAFIYAILILFCYNRYAETKSSIVLAFYGLLILLCCASDMIILMIMILPILFYALIAERDRLPIGVTILAAGAGATLDKGLCVLGGVNKNAFLDTRKFIYIHKGFEKFGDFLEGISELLRCDFSGKPLLAISTARYFLYSLIAVAAVVIVIRNLGAFSQNKAKDRITTILSLSLTLMGLICTLTDIYSSTESNRYIAYFPTAIGIILVRNLPRKPALTATALFCAALCLITPPHGRIITKQDRLALALRDLGLKNGYASFWNASHTTVASGETVTVRSIRVRERILGNPDFIEAQNWFCKTEWYNEPANFVVVDNVEYLNTSEKNIQMLLGDPSQRIELEDGYRVLIYDRDISSEIIHPEEMAKP